jgi:hypothetical protein
LTPKRWCQQRGIGTATLQYWLKREREDAAGFSLVPVEVGNMALDTGFLDMSVNGVKMQVWWAVT